MVDKKFVWCYTFPTEKGGGIYQAGICRKIRKGFVVFSKDSFSNRNFVYLLWI